MGSEILRCAQDDNPELASFDSQIVLFEMYWGLPPPWGGAGQPLIETLELAPMLAYPVPGRLAQLGRLSHEVREQALQLLPDKRVDDTQVVDHQGGAVIEVDKLLAGAQRVQLLAVPADEQEALEIAAMWLQGDGLEALDRALLLQLGIVLDSLVEDL